MDRKRLSIALSRVPDHPEPKSRLEQVRTPGPVAADLLLEAHAAGDIEGRYVVDLGCGTGVLAIGAALLGAERVVALDVDEDALAVARAAAAQAGVADRIVFSCRDLIGVTPTELVGLAGAPLDTTVMNPPFGADLGSRAAGGDRVFLSLAFRTTRHVYSLHAATTERFLVAFARDAGFAAERAEVVAFPLPARHAHHRDIMRTVPVGVYRFERRNGGPTAGRSTRGGRSR